MAEMLIVRGEGVGEVVSLVDLLRDNADDDEFCEGVIRLVVQEVYRGGGGAAPEIEIRRVQ